MKYTILSKTNLKYVRGSDDMKVKYLIEDANGRRFMALYWRALNGRPVVYDAEYDLQVLKNNGWSLSGTGYMYNHTINMHKLIEQLAKLEGEGQTVDHINGYKLDNRARNLRKAMQCDQNSNRGSRSDKLPPCEELQAACVTELPRHVRWDKTEKKFVIEKHPQLIKDVENGVRSKATMSGSKSVKLSIIEKYQDILARLKELDDAAYSETNAQFKQLKKDLTKEYEEICRCIELFYKPDLNSITQSTTDDQQSETHVQVVQTKPTIVAVKHTCAGKKSVSKLPENCQVKHEDIPKYCYYSAKSDKRSDSFTINRHPQLIAEGNKTWSTTSRVDVSTHDKFLKLIEKYNELEAAKAQS
jgi:hypothetical protein